MIIQYPKKMHLIMIKSNNNKDFQIKKVNSIKIMILKKMRMNLLIKLNFLK